MTKNKIKINHLITTLNNISFTQLVLISLISLVFLPLKQYNIFSGLVVSALASFAYTQLLKISSYSKLFSLYGFPLRLVLVGIPTAILVHKTHSNLIALFIGFIICLIVYFIYFFSYAKNELK